MEKLSRREILDAWRRLGELAHQDGKSIDIIVVGGAVMAVHFQSRPSTADVDAIFEPAPETGRWAQTVAEERGLPSDWLNDGAKAYVTVASPGPLLYQGRGIFVRTVALEHLIALKLMAWRDDIDFNDALSILRVLVDAHPGKLTLEKLRALVEPFFIPAQRMKASYALEELWDLYDASRGDRSADPRAEPA